MNKKHVEHARILGALGHPVRLAIVKGLEGNECNVTKIVKGLGLPQSTVSQHLARLRAAGVLGCRRKGVKSCYAITSELVRKLLKEL